MAWDLSLAIALVFVAVATLSGALAWVVLARLTPERRRLQALAAGSTSGIVVPLTTLGDEDTRLRRLLRRIPKSPHEMSRLQRRLARAGKHGPGPALLYAASEFLLPILGLVAFVLWFGLRPAFLALGAGVALILYLLPGLILERMIRSRQRKIRNGLPDAIDLLIVCIEAGSSLDQAVLKASEELGISYPALAEELRYVNTEIKAGKPRLEAFKNFADRTKVDDVRALVAMLVQTDRFGTSVGQALRTFADAARTRRRQEAEERAAKLGVKLLFPLVFCLFPAMFVVLLGPAAVRIFRVLIAPD